MPKKIIHVDEIGHVTFKKNKRSKNVSITLRPTQGVVVNFPYFLSYKFALNVVEKKRNWILNHLPKIQETENKATLFVDGTSFKSRSKEYILQKCSCEKLEIHISQHKTLIKFPENINVQNPKVQELLKSAVIEALRVEAKEYLPKRTLELAQKYQFGFNKIFVKNTKTIWGSCSGRNNINLNLHLIRLPDHLIDYVIIHELCHTVEKNHGKSFWRLMDSLLGNAKILAKELKNYSIQIY